MEGGEFMVNKRKNKAKETKKKSSKEKDDCGCGCTGLKKDKESIDLKKMRAYIALIEICLKGGRL